MKKRLFAMLIALVMLFTGTAFAEDVLLIQSPEDDMAKVNEYSTYMQKNIIRTYAQILANNYYYGIDDEELLFAAICSMVDEGKVDIDKILERMIKALGDEHAEFYNKEDFALLTQNISGEFSGIGVSIVQGKEGILTVSVFEGSPAEKAGIMENDLIVGVEGTRVEGMSVNAVRNLIVGEIGTPVRLTIRRGGEEFNTTCIRAKVVANELETAMINDKTAYMTFAQFTTNLPEEVAAFVKEIRTKSVKNLIIDLRNNPGGELNAAVEIAKMFISAGQLGEIRYKNEANNVILRSENFNAPRFKILVLVNEHSASASEFLAMAFQSRGAAKIMGTTTYGKGSMQIVTKNITGSGMKYTVGEFYSYKGQRINTVGITPDIVVENEFVPVDEKSFTPIDYDKVDVATTDAAMTLALEQRLAALGYMEEADEVFDDTTKKAVSRIQAFLGYDITGIPGFYEYLYLNDYTYDFDIEIDKQMEAAIRYFR